MFNAADGVIAEVLGLFGRFGWKGDFDEIERKVMAYEGDVEAPVRKIYLAWIAGERNEFGRATEFAAAARLDVRTLPWAALIEGFVAQSRRFHNVVRERIAEAETYVSAESPHFRAALLRLESVNAYTQGEIIVARRLLYEALEIIKPGDFSYGRILDALGATFAAENNFYAEPFFLEAESVKVHAGDDVGLAVTYGQLGRLYVDRGRFDEAKNYFQKDLGLCRAMNDRFGTAKMLSALGRLELTKIAHKRPTSTGTSRQLEEAVRSLNEAAGLFTELDDQVGSAFARKDIALAGVLSCDIGAAKRAIQEALSLLSAIDLPEGMAHCRLVEGRIAAAAGKPDQAVAKFGEARAIFERINDLDFVAECDFETALVRLERCDECDDVVESLISALVAAEKNRRWPLIARIETILRRVDPAKYWEHSFWRVRSRGCAEDTATLTEGQRCEVTVLYLDIKDSTKFGEANSPIAVAMTINQLMNDCSTILRRRQGWISSFRGDGFLAVFSRDNHAEDAVLAGLELIGALAEFNRPRRYIRLSDIAARIGVATGEVFLGNIGTYDKISCSVIGSTANLGARIEAAAAVGCVTISSETHRRVKDRFVFKAATSRPIPAKGIASETVDVWDVIGES